MSDSVWPLRWQPTRLPVPGNLQARTLEWVAISFSNAWKWKVKVKLFSRVRPLATPWTAYQAPPSMGFSRQEYWSGLPFPSPIAILSHLLFSNSILITLSLDFYCSWETKTRCLIKSCLLSPWNLLSLSHIVLTTRFRCPELRHYLTTSCHKV